ncbi:RHS repeat protein [Mucilaginibacter boryungensis]|uniref:RHS repeat-associated protein n=1 Tax=Mucilaginibacter boryungensis TaxID=768480 RepID=A0ABR9XLL1_9SPHI|nr:RHS repeat-associated core domain-containing protein [Mucilaginibacter boryungensis]MBE9668120.1 hypothetical protein [Mucilaginibacter boryungensis]
MKKLLSIYIALSIVSATYGQTNRPNGTTAPAGTRSSSYSLPGSFATPSFYNYTQTWVPQIPLTDTSTSKFHYNGTNTIPVSTNYYNGLGQSLMRVVHGNHDTHFKDILYPNDVRYSRTHTDLLPYTLPQNSGFQLDPFDDAFGYNLGLYANEDYTAYSQQVTPDNQSTLTSVSYAPGKSFVGEGRGVTATVIFNDVADSITKYFVNASGAIDGFGTHYNTSDLTVNTTSGAHGQVIKTFVNKSGQAVCKQVYAGLDKHAVNIWQTTYYVYDLSGKLCYILPPLVSAAKPTAVNFSTYAALYYQYKYDKYGNQIEADIPGKTGPIYEVYDNQFRPVMIQTPLLRAQGKWKFALYDTRGRIVMNGIAKDTNSSVTWQGWANGSVTPSGGVVTGSLLYYILNGATTSVSAIANCEIRTYNYYDSYSADPSFSSNTFGNINSLDFATDPSAITPAPYLFTQGKLVASKTKIIDSANTLPNPWILSVYFYDQKGNLIQVQTKNVWNASGWDTTTMQYNFAGNKVYDLTHHHAWTGCKKVDTKLANKYLYDFMGRLYAVQQKADSGNWRIIANYNFDDLGRTSSKNLGGVEQQDYTYNIRGQLESVNADYLSSPMQPDKTFGCFLSYDYGFDSVRYDGGVSGIQWRGAGLLTPLRAYGYKYDPAGRLNYADFNENSSGMPGAWSKSSNDFSMSNVTYDVNGNILTMNQMGTSTSGPVFIDKLTYTYPSASNQLQRVQDGITTNYGLGDFQDIAGTNDYYYDADGNIISDNNKNITAITYNDQDLPLTVKFYNHSTINNIYDASGRLVQKIVADSTIPHIDTYRYWGAFNYRNDSLQYIDHGEGRARWMADSSIFKYDFYVKDQLGNVRTIVTSDEGSPISYFASHEIASAGLESSIFANLDSVRDLKPGSTNPYDVQAAHLDGSDAQRRIGTALLMSVMAGDKFDISATSYYDTNSAGMTTYADPNSMLNAITTSLVNGVGGYASEGNNTAMVSSLFTTSNYLGIYEGVLDNLTDYTRPRAFINYLVFDQGMNLVPQQSGAVQVSGTPGSWQVIGTSGPITIGQNGYVSIYMSDEQFLPVYMDQLHVTYYRGRLIQEQHYYPFGLPINPVTSSGTLPSNTQIEGNDTHKELGLNQSDFNFRQYDYQIGRFTSIDPIAGSMGQEDMSPYHFVGNDPANFIDPRGLNRGDPPLNGGELPEVTVTATRTTPYSDPTMLGSFRPSEYSMSFASSGSWGGGGSGGGASYSMTTTIIEPFSTLDPTHQTFVHLQTSPVRQIVNTFDPVQFSQVNVPQATLLEPPSFWTNVWSSVVQTLISWDNMLDPSASYSQKGGEIYYKHNSDQIKGRQPNLVPKATERIYAMTNIEGLMQLFSGKTGSGGISQIWEDYESIENVKSMGESIEGVYELNSKEPLMEPTPIYPGDGGIDFEYKKSDTSLWDRKAERRIQKAHYDSLFKYH